MHSHAKGRKKKGREIKILPGVRGGDVLISPRVEGEGEKGGKREGTVLARQKGEAEGSRSKFIRRSIAMEGKGGNDLLRILLGREGKKGWRGKGLFRGGKELFSIEREESPAIIV